MKHYLNRALVPGLGLVLGAPLAVAAPAATDSLVGMVTDGDATLNFRYRYENVDQDSFDRTASANTLRSRISLSSAAWHGISALGEVDNVWDFGSDNYNSTENGDTTRPVIADPSGTDLNQLWLRWAGEGLDATAGRQRINHGNQRFVGGVAWRQNEQTFDGLRANWKPLDGLNLDASYIYNVNRIFGPDDGANPADLEGDNVFLRADYGLGEQHKFGAYGYLLDFDEDGPYAPGKTVDNSTDTYGLEYRGSFDRLSLALAWATQSEAGDSTLDYDADYYLAEASAKVQRFSFKAGYEVLGAGDGVGFKTPLATLHKFQGWADTFLNTPADGIEDLYGGVGAALGPVTLTAVYHDFQAEDSSEDYGTEVDLSARWAAHKHVNLELKYASFDADSENYSDTEKVWLVAQFVF